jgi:hypothetical protein
MAVDTELDGELLKEIKKTYAAVSRKGARDEGDRMSLRPPSRGGRRRGALPSRARAIFSLIGSSFKLVTVAGRRANCANPLGIERQVSERSLEEARHDHVGREDLLGERPCEPALALVIRRHRLERPDRAVERLEAEHRFAVRKDPARPGELDDRRLAAREAAERSVADPGVLGPAAGGLRAAELAARAPEARSSGTKPSSSVSAPSAASAPLRP